MNTQAPNSSTTAPYHHGDLREPLLSEAAIIIREGGIGALTLRGLTKRLGVTHTAPRHHFDGLGGVLTALATRQFEAQLAEMQAAAAGSPFDPISQLSAAGKGYLRHVAKSGELFDLQFNFGGLHREDPGFQAAASAAYKHLEALVLAAAPDEQQDRQTALIRMIWAQIHGLALLYVSNEHTFRNMPDLAEREAAALEIFNDFVQTLLSPVLTPCPKQ